MAYPTGPAPRVIETGLSKWRMPRDTDATRAAEDKRLAHVAAVLAELDLPLDHHWDRDHPDYDPNCFCGDPSSARQLADMAAAAGAATEFDVGDTEPAARQAVAEGKRNRRPMSDGQRSYIEALNRRIQDPSLMKTVIDALAGKMTWAEASRLIDKLRQSVGAQIRPNSYAQGCRLCGVEVPAKEGSLIKDDRGRWLVEHVGECPEPPEAPSDDAQIAAIRPSGLDLSKLPPGRYAIPGGDSRLKVRIDRPTKGNWAGYTFVKDAAEYGQGQRYGRQDPHPEARYNGKIQAELEVILADPRAAIAEYGKITGTCGVCSRTLEDEESVRLGIGPVCRSKGEWASY